MTMSPPILVLVQDLFFRAKIEATARAGGWPVWCVHDVASLPDAVACRACLIDLESAGADALARLPGIAARVPTIAFASHGRIDLLEAARAAGCREALPRSRLAAELARVLGSLAAGGDP